MQQLPLGIRLNPGATLENFVPGGNTQVVASLKTLLQNPREPFLFLWGDAGVGKSHLLQALCHEAAHLGRSSAYIPLSKIENLDPEMLQGLDALDLVCIDDAQHIAANAPWEQGLFHLFNRLRDKNVCLLLACDRSPAALGITLPDLASRLSWGLCYQIEPLNESAMQAALIQGATDRGLQLSEEAALYLMRRCPRDMGFLTDLLCRLDQASLAAQRQLTIPFLRLHLDSLGANRGRD